MLIVSLLSQAIHVAPFEQAAGRVGALYSSADRDAVRRVPHRVTDPTAPPRRRPRRRRRGARRPRRAGRDLAEVFGAGRRGGRGRRREPSPGCGRRARAAPAGSSSARRARSRVSTTTTSSTTRPAGRSTPTPRRRSCWSPTSPTASPRATASAPANTAALDTRPDHPALTPTGLRYRARRRGTGTGYPGVYRRACPRWSVDMCSGQVYRLRRAGDPWGHSADDGGMVVVEARTRPGRGKGWTVFAAIMMLLAGGNMVINGVWALRVTARWRSPSGTRCCSAADTSTPGDGST